MLIRLSPLALKIFLETRIKMLKALRKYVMNLGDGGVQNRFLGIHQAMHVSEIYQLS